MSDALRCGFAGMRRGRAGSDAEPRRHAGRELPIWPEGRLAGNGGGNILWSMIRRHLARIRMVFRAYLTQLVVRLPTLRVTARGERTVENVAVARTAHSRVCRYFSAIYSFGNVPNERVNRNIVSPPCARRLYRWRWPRAPWQPRPVRSIRWDLRAATACRPATWPPSTA